MYEFLAFAIATTFNGAFLSRGQLGKFQRAQNVAKLHQQIIWELFTYSFKYLNSHYYPHIYTHLNSPQKTIFAL